MHRGSRFHTYPSFSTVLSVWATTAITIVITATLTITMRWSHCGSFHPWFFILAHVFRLVTRTSSIGSSINNTLAFTARALKYQTQLVHPLSFSIVCSLVCNLLAGHACWCPYPWPELVPNMHTYYQVLQELGPYNTARTLTAILPYKPISHISWSPNLALWK